MAVTINQILKSLEDVATAHLQINHFEFGDNWEFFSSGTVNFPALVVRTEANVIS